MDHTERSTWVVAIGNQKGGSPDKQSLAWMIWGM